MLQGYACALAAVTSCGVSSQSIYTYSHRGMYEQYTLSYDIYTVAIICMYTCRWVVVWCFIAVYLHLFTPRYVHIYTAI